MKSFTVVNNGAQKPIDEYYISIDMAKEICMIQRSDKGRWVEIFYYNDDAKFIIENNL